MSWRMDPNQPTIQVGDNIREIATSKTSAAQKLLRNCFRFLLIAQILRKSMIKNPYWNINRENVPRTPAHVS